MAVVVICARISANVDAIHSVRVVTAGQMYLDGEEESGCMMHGAPILWMSYSYA